MDAGGQPHRQPEPRSADDAGQNGPYGTGVGDGIVYPEPEVGAENRKNGKDKIEGKQMPGMKCMNMKRTEKRRLRE